MRASYATRREFLRRVYRKANESGTTRDEFLDAIADKAHVELDGSKTLTGASGGGVSSNYLSFFSIWGPQDRLELVDWARDYIAEDDVADSLALVTGPIRFVGSDFSGVVH